MARRLRRRLSLLVGVLLLLGVTPARAAEPDAAAELGLTVTAGFGGQGVPGTWVPVEVAVQPTRLVAGTLEVSGRSEGGGATRQRAVEVTAGSRKVYRFLMPSGSAAVRVREGGADPVAVRLPVRPVAGGAWLTGVLGSLPSDLPVLRNEPTGASGTWVEVDPAWVELSPSALESLGGLVADRAALDDLTDDGRRNLAVAVASGLDLILVADPAGVPDAGLPWQAAAGAAPAGFDDGGAVVAVTPAAGTWSVSAADLFDGPDTPIAAGLPAGLGRVLVVGAAPGVGQAGRSQALWSALASPRRASSSEGDWRADRSPWQLGRLLQPPGGTATPSLPWLAAFMAVYVLVVGPVNGLVLARLRRRELAWVTVPLVTAVFTSAAFVGAVRDQPETGIAGRLAYWTDGVGVEAVVVGARSPTPGTHRVELAGQGWTARTVVESQGGATVRDEGEVVVEMDLAALQLGGVSARRPLDGPPPLDVDAVAGRDGLTVTVTNTGTQTVRGVRVRAAGSTRRVADLEPGGSDTAVLDTPSLPVGVAHGDPFSDMGARSLPGTMEVVLRGDVADGSPGLVWATGVTDDAVDAVTVGGQPPQDVGSVVAVGVHASHEPGHLSPFTATRDLVAHGPDLHRYAPHVVEGPGEAFLRFRLPPDTSPTALRSDLDRGAQHGQPIELRVWDVPQRSWTPVVEAFGRDGTAGDPATLVGPFGEVWVRATGELFPFEFSGRSLAGAQEVGR